MEKEIAFLNALGYGIEIVGIVLTFMFSNIVPNGAFMRLSTKITTQEKRELMLVRIGFACIVIGALLQLTQAIYSYSQYK